MAPNYPKHIEAMQPKRGTIDFVLLITKALLYLVCLVVAAAAAYCLSDLNVRSWRIDFLLLASAQIAALVLYFSVGLALLRVLIPRYTQRLRLGERGHAYETPVLALLSDVILHAAALMVYGQDSLSVALVLASALFFAYPFYYLVNTLWSLQPEVRKAVSGKTPLRTSCYANTPLEVPPNAKINGGDAYLPVTICLPVYTESNEVIFNTINSSLAALQHYRTLSGKEANLLVCDDGLAKLLEGNLSQQSIAGAVAGGGAPASEGAQASGYAQASERIDFYRRKEISFVARPLEGRAGKFRKSSNLNYAAEFARCVACGISTEKLLAPEGPFAGGYAEGEVVIHDVILLLDKDSGLEPGIITATLPEFAADPSLAFTQHATRAQNAGDNYFAWMMARFTDLVYHLTLPTKALQGLQVHLMGHNAFVRKAFLEQTQGWAENRVSEDYAKALTAYSTGWHGRFIAYPGLDFSEQVCQSFSEETSKQLRYSYGITEIAPDRRLKLKATMRTDLVLYYLSYINLIAALPMMLVLLYLHQIYYLFAGIIVNAIIFVLVPIVQGWILGRSVGFTSVLAAPRYFLLNALSYMGYSFSMLKGFVLFFSDSIRGSYKPFGATSVDALTPNFGTGVRLLAGYLRDNIFVIVFYCGIIAGCLSVLSDYPAHIIRPLIALFLVSHVVSPVALTPQLFPFLLPRRVKQTVMTPDKSGT